MKRLSWRATILRPRNDSPTFCLAGDKEALSVHGFTELFFSDRKCDLDDKGSDFFEQNHGDRHLREDGGMFDASNLWLVEYGEIVFGGGVGSLSS